MSLLIYVDVPTYIHADVGIVHVDIHDDDYEILGYPKDNRFISKLLADKLHFLVVWGLWQELMLVVMKIVAMLIMCTEMSIDNSFYPRC